MIMDICNLCGSQNLKLFCDCQDYKLIKCKECGLLVTDQDSILKKNLYSNDYFEGVHSNFFADCKVDYEKHLNSSDKLKNFSFILDKLKAVKSEGKFLDIGSATGVFLDMARKKGYNVVGVDVSEYACDYAKKNFKLNVKCGKLEDLRLKDKSFDIITMWDLIEHVPDPKVFLKEVNRILKDDGIIYLLTINDASLMGYLSKWIYYLSFKKINFFVKLIHPIHHNYHFEEKHLMKYLDNAGFKVIWKKKSEMPVSTIEQGAFVKSLARILYFFSENLNWQHEIKIIARKK